jgi:hypothetical protein
MIRFIKIPMPVYIILAMILITLLFVVFMSLLFDIATIQGD